LRIKSKENEGMVNWLEPRVLRSGGLSGLGGELSEGHGIDLNGLLIQVHIGWKI